MAFPPATATGAAPSAAATSDGLRARTILLQSQCLLQGAPQAASRGAAIRTVTCMTSMVPPPPGEGATLGGPKSPRITARLVRVPAMAVKDSREVVIEASAEEIFDVLADGMQVQPVAHARSSN